MSLQVHTINGHYRDEGGLLTRGSLTLIDIQGRGICTDEGGSVRARRYMTAGLECFELYGRDIGFRFLADKGECERIGIPIDHAQ